jgi:hypothetical protein
MRLHNQVQFPMVDEVNKEALKMASATLSSEPRWVLAGILRKEPDQKQLLRKAEMKTWSIMSELLY